jgi:serine kinase of HPr protein (carbohydrate metabolism regulator)
MDMAVAEKPIRVNANAVALGESGVLIRGDSGAGKSSLSLALVEAWRSQGDFARLVGDDCILVRIKGGRALLSPHQAISGLAEWRGIGVMKQDYERCAVLALIVDLESGEAHASCPRIPEVKELCCNFHGLRDIPLLRLSARETERSVPAIMAFLHKLSAK